MPDVYILKCANGAYYVGLAQNDLEGRVSEHQLGLDPKAWTFKRRPVELFSMKIMTVLTMRLHVNGNSKAGLG